MQELDINRLEDEELTLARVLLKNHLITEKAIIAYVDFLNVRDNIGKAYLGELLVKLKYIPQADLDEFIEENRKRHLEFCEELAQKGFISEVQKKTIFEKQKETGRDVISLLTDLNIMTRDVFSRIYGQQKAVLRLGEWLVLNRKVTQEKIDRARKLQKLSGLEDYLSMHGYLPKQTIKLVKDKLAAHSA